METLRYIDYLKPNGLVITNNRVIKSPVNLQLGIESLDLDKLMDAIEEWPSRLFIIDA